MTGFFPRRLRNTGPSDHGRHTVCVRVTEEFLAFSRRHGNDLSTPRLMFGFAGLNPSDRWCLCAERWRVQVLQQHAMPGRSELRH